MLQVLYVWLLSFSKSKTAKVVVFGCVAIALVLGLSLAPAGTDTVQAATGPYAMKTLSTCSWSGQAHCRWVTVDLKSYPKPECVYIVFTTADYAGILRMMASSLTMTRDVNLGNGYHNYGWAVPTRFALLYNGRYGVPNWSNSSNWKLYLTC